MIAYQGQRRARGNCRSGQDRRAPPGHRRARRHLGRSPLYGMDCRSTGPANTGTPRRAAISKGCSPHCRATGTIITVIDGHPATLAWLGVVDGHKAIPLGVEQFGQTGTIPDLYEHIGLEARSIVEAISGPHQRSQAGAPSIRDECVRWGRPAARTTPHRVARSYTPIANRGSGSPLSRCLKRKQRSGQRPVPRARPASCAGSLS